ncbi:MAG: hypothetical protein Q7U10_11355 [Thermodesulfovibrionia bacterium]|nr:hypothetical protein [Thermodesulfovibrionia bacterium]
MKRFLKLFALLLLIISIAAVNTACNSKKKPAETKQQEQTNQQNTSPHADPITTDTRPIISGKVVETMNASSYTYVKLVKDGKEIWVAIPEAKIKIGDEMSFYPGDEMRNFNSITLHRTFDSVIFSPGKVDKAAGVDDALQKNLSKSDCVQSWKYNKSAFKLYLNTDSCEDNETTAVLVTIRYLFESNNHTFPKKIEVFNSVGKEMGSYPFENIPSLSQ